MTSKPDGGPAFPRPYGTDEHSQPCNSNADQQGMTLRQYYKGEALAMLSNENVISEIQIQSRREGVNYPEYLAGICCNIADALIAEDEQ